MTPHLYHVTLASNLMSIQEDGLVPGAGASSFGGGYAGHVRDRAFVCEAEAVECWWNKIDDLVQHHFESEQILEDHRIPVVLRLAVDADLSRDLQPDEIGSRDCIGGASYFFTGEPVSSMDIDVWNGSRWTSILDLDDEEDVTGPYISVQETEEDDDGEWLNVELQLPNWGAAT